MDPKFAKFARSNFQSSNLGGLEDFVDGLTNAFVGAADQTVDKIVIETAFTPPLVINKPFAASGSGGPSPVVKVLKPRITIQYSNGLRPTVIKPGGDPSTSLWPVVALGGVLSLAVVGGLIFRGVIPCKCKK